MNTTESNVCEQPWRSVAIGLAIEPLLSFLSPFWSKHLIIDPLLYFLPSCCNKNPGSIDTTSTLEGTHFSIWFTQILDIAFVLWTYYTRTTVLGSVKLACALTFNGLELRFIMLTVLLANNYTDEWWKIWKYSWSNPDDQIFWSMIASLLMDSLVFGGLMANAGLTDLRDTPQGKILMLIGLTVCCSLAVGIILFLLGLLLYSILKDKYEESIIFTVACLLILPAGLLFIWMIVGPYCISWWIWSLSYKGLSVYECSYGYVIAIVTLGHNINIHIGTFIVGLSLPTIMASLCGCRFALGGTIENHPEDIQDQGRVDASKPWLPPSPYFYNRENDINQRRTALDGPGNVENHLDKVDRVNASNRWWLWYDG